MQGNPMTVLDSGLQVLDSGLQPFAAFWITWIRIAFSKVQDFGFHKKEFSDSGIRNTFIGAKSFILALKELFSATYKTVNTNVTLFQHAK